MKIGFAFASAALLAFAAPAGAEPAVQQIIYQVDAVARCSQAAAGTADLKQGLYHCDVALRDPTMDHRAALLVDRGIVKSRLGDTDGALGDFNAAIALDPKLGDAYVNRGVAYITLKRYGDAMADVTEGMQLGAGNMAAAFFRAERSRTMKATIRQPIAITDRRWP